MGIVNLQSETMLSGFRKKIFGFISLFIIIISIYSNTFHVPWHFDDEKNILNNKALHLTELNWQNVRNTFFAGPGGRDKLNRPVACFSLALNYYLGKDNVFGYHAVNISVHYLASIFLFLFVFHTLNLPLLRAKYGPNAYSIALLTSVFWAINPVQTQAVTYIVQRMAGMAGMFYIMSMFFYLKGRVSEHNSNKAFHYLLCLVFGLSAFGSKENAAMLPISILLFDLFLIQGLKKQHVKKNAVIFLILIFVPLILALIITGPSILSLNSGYHIRSFTLLERLFTEPRVIFFYISLLLYPMPNRLCLVHDFPISHGLITPYTTIIAIFTILGIIYLAIIKSKRLPFISFCTIFFFLNHLIESSIFPLELIFEHRNYLPSMLFFAPIAILIIKAIQFFSYKRGMQFIFAAFVILILIGEGHGTFIRNMIWKTGESLWMDAVEKYPLSQRAHHNLGRYYGQKGLREKEMAEYQIALKLDKGSYGITEHLTHYNIGLIYLSKDQEDNALVHLLKTVELYPEFSDAYLNIGFIYMNKRQYDKALHYFKKTLTYNINNFKAYNNIGHILIKENKIEEAIHAFKKVLSIEKNFSSALRGLGIAYKKKNEYGKAKYFFERALKENRKRILTRLHLLETLLLMKDDMPAKTFLAETFDIIPPDKMRTVIKGIQTNGFPYEETPELKIILPLLEKDFIENEM